MANMGYDSQADHQLPAMTPGAVSERGPNTPWNNDDYEFPHSAGPVRKSSCLTVLALVLSMSSSFFLCIIAA